MKVKKERINDYILEKSIEELELGVQYRQYLKENGIFQIKDLYYRSKEEMEELFATRQDLHIRLNNVLNALHLKQKEKRETILWNHFDVQIQDPSVMIINGFEQNVLYVQLKKAHFKIVVENIKILHRFTFRQNKQENIVVIGKEKSDYWVLRYNMNKQSVEMGRFDQAKVKNEEEIKLLWNNWVKEEKIECMKLDAGVLKEWMQG